MSPGCMLRSVVPSCTGLLHSLCSSHCVAFSSGHQVKPVRGEHLRSRSPAPEACAAQAPLAAVSAGDNDSRRASRWAKANAGQEGHAWLPIQAGKGLPDERQPSWCASRPSSRAVQLPGAAGVCSPPMASPRRSCPPGMGCRSPSAACKRKEDTVGTPALLALPALGPGRVAYANATAAAWLAA